MGEPRGHPNPHPNPDPEPHPRPNPRPNPHPIDPHPNDPNPNHSSPSHPNPSPNTSPRRGLPPTSVAATAGAWGCIQPPLAVLLLYGKEEEVDVTYY